jgi:hypothetical protein
MRVLILARLGANQPSGLELNRSYQVYGEPDPDGRVLVFDDHQARLCWVTPAAYQQVPDPLKHHQLVRIEHRPGGYVPLCSCGWRWPRRWPDPDEAAAVVAVHQRRLAIQRLLLDDPIPPPMLIWHELLRAERHRQHQQPGREPER